MSMERSKAGTKEKKRSPDGLNYQNTIIIIIITETLNFNSTTITSFHWQTVEINNFLNNLEL